MKFLIRIIVFLLLFFTSLQPQSIDYKVTYFQAKNFNRETYEVAIQVAKEEHLQNLLYSTELQRHIQPQKLKTRIYINGIQTKLVDNTLKRKSKRTIEFDIYALAPVPSGRQKLQLIDKKTSTVLTETDTTIPDRFFHKGQQPNINRASPAGGSPGSIISLSGYHFGDNIDNIKIIFISSEKSKYDTTFGENLITAATPIYLAAAGKTDHNGKALDEIKFVLPQRLNQIYLNFWQTYITGKTINYYLLVNHRPTQIKTITLLPTSWKIVRAIQSLFVTLLFLSLIALFTRRWNFLPLILIDKRTNSYSIANFQSLAWTLTFIASYFYIAVSKLFILADGELPDFNLSLISLMGISYGGLIASNMMDKKRPEPSDPDKPARLADLFNDDRGGIDIGKLQLFGFTIITIIVYFANLLTDDTLLGLPDIPASLQTLLLGSQGGYIGSRFARDTVELLSAHPTSFFVGEKEKTITLTGNGFMPGSRLTIPGHEPVECQFDSPNTLRAIIPEIIEEGEHQIILLTPTGQTVVSAFKVNFKPKEEET